MALCTCMCAFAILLGLFAGGKSLELRSINTEAKVRAQLTLDGFFNYYWKKDQNNQNIAFFFACGQIGGDGTSDVNQCSCYSTSACVNCYRWWSAVALESVATYGIFMNTTNNSIVADMTYEHSPYNANWNPDNAFIDDFLWYGITYLRVYEWLNDTKWLDHSIDLFDWAMKYGWQDPCGGIVWCYDETRSFKDNIQIVQAMHLSAKLAYLHPNGTEYLNWAERIWNWFFSFNNGRGIVTDQNILSTGLVPERCCNATSSSYTRCRNSNIHGTAYNQGIFLSAAAYLYLGTGNKSYIEASIRVIDAVIANYTFSDGVLIDESRSYQSYSDVCSAGADPGGDWYSFNGVFMLHLSYYIDLLTKNGSLPLDTLKKIGDFVQKTSDSAWKKSAVWPPFNNTNGCKYGSAPIDKNASYPKFHWWWEKDETGQMIPPDPRYFFHKFKVHCASIGNDTQIWKGMIGSELKCTLECNKYKNCSKYLYQLNQNEVPGYDCWIWSYNRTDHICNQTDPNWNIGVKRPIGDVSCANKCGSSEPQVLDEGVCYCDANCSKSLDCCSDYADYCTPKKPITCNGHCNKAEPQAIPGGGYCWCDSACNPSYTDNNSDGSCCADYPQQCLGVKMPPCLDARTQGSALNLFLGHVSVSQAMKSYN